MLESMRKHAQGWIAKVILGAIILSFALWGVGDYFTGNKVEVVAEVDGEIIHKAAFLDTYKRQLNSYQSMLGDQLTKELAEQLGVKNETLQTMVNRRLMLAEADALGLVVPDEAVLGTVQSNPAFQDAKNFSTTRYQGLVRQMGFASPRDYENYLRQSIMIDTLQKAVIGSVSVSDEEVLKRFKAKFEKRVLTALVVNPADLKAKVKVNDEQARAWFESHAELYQSPLRVDIQVVDIDAKKIAANIVISDADIEQAYADRQSEFTAPEKRRASHILVRVAKDASPDVLSVAQEKIKAAQKRIQAGEAFAAVAKDVSDDVTASEGGDLGFFASGAMVSEFEEAVFSELKVGDVSDVIQTQYGLHLIQLNDIQEEKVKALSDVRDLLHDQLLEQASADEAYRLSEDLDNALGMEGELKLAAAKVNLPVQEFGKLSQDNSLANPLLATSKDLKDKAFSMMPGSNVEILEVSNGHFVALEVMKRTDPETMPYEEVVKRVYDDVQTDEARKQAQAIADKILEAGLAGESIKALAQKYGQPQYTSKPVLSSGEGDGAAWLPAVLAASFRAPEASWVDATLPTSQGIAIVFVQDVRAADDKTLEKESEAVREEAIKAKGAVRFARWMASVRDRHEITVNNKVLDGI